MPCFFVRRAFTASAAILLTTTAFAAPKILTKVDRADDIRKELGLTDELLKASNLPNVKIAVLDAGFAGVEAEMKDRTAPRYLPLSTELIETYGRKNLPGFEPGEAHGRHLAQILWAMTGFHDDGPQFHLYNANGPENFVEAVKALIEWKADVVVCSRNWETLGNFDGKGFINKAVEAATDEGILWIQAAGNYHKKVFNAPLVLHAEKINNGKEDSEWVTLPYSNSFIRFNNLVDDNNVKITLSWSAFHPGEEAKGTKKDLDLYLYKYKEGGQLELVAEATKRQTDAAKVGDGQTWWATESIEKKLRASGDGKYMLAVRKIAGDFDAAKDKLRITVTGSKQPFLDEKTQKRLDPIDFVDATDDGEIMVPADNRYAVTVGDFSPQSSRGPTVDSRGKPEILFPRSNVNFTDRNAYFGTSYAAAYMGAIAAVLKGREPLLSRDHLLRFRSKDPAKVLKANGWSADAPYQVLWNDEYVRAKFGSLVKWDRVALRGNVDGLPSMGFLDAFKNIDLFKTLPDNVKANPEGYDIFVFPKVTPTVKTVQDEPTTKRGPPQMVITKPAYWDTKSTYVGTVGTTAGNYNLYLNYTQLVPAKVEERPGPEYQVPGAYRQVPGAPIVELPLYYREKNSKIQLPFDLDEKRYPRATFLRVEPASVVRTEGRGRVADGSDEQPKLWVTPTLTELRQTVGGGR